MIYSVSVLLSVKWMLSPSLTTIIPSSSPIALNTFINSLGLAPVMSSGGNSSSLSVGTSAPIIAVISNSPPSGSTSISTSSIPALSSVSTVSSSIPSTSSVSSSSCSCKDFFDLEPNNDSFTSSLISSFIVEASIPFAFSLIASSIDFICNKVFSTKFSFFSKLILFFCNALCVYFIYINIS